MAYARKGKGRVVTPKVVFALDTGSSVWLDVKDEQEAAAIIAAYHEAVETGERFLKLPLRSVRADRVAAVYYMGPKTA